MAAGVAVLLLGVVALSMLMPKPEPKTVADPERSVIWLYDDSKQQNLLILLVESRSKSTLTAVPLPGAFTLDGTPVDVGAAFRSKNLRAGHEALAAAIGRQVHRRIGIPTGVLATLIDAAGGVDIEGSRMSGSQALQWLMASQGGEQASRATTAFLATLDAVNRRGISMGLSEGLALARKVETNGDLMGMQKIFERWSSYGTPKVAMLVGADGSVSRAALEAALLEDPVPESK